MIVAHTGNYTAPVGATVTNVENITIAASGTNDIDTTTGYAGLTSITAIGAGGTNVTAASTTSITATNTGANAMAIIGGGGTGTFTTGAAAVTVGQTAVVNAYTSVSVIGGSTVAISDNATTTMADGTTLKTVSLKGNTAAATLNTDGLTTLNLVNNNQNVTVNAIAGTRTLTINESNTTGTSTLQDNLATTVVLNHTGATASVGITLNATAATAVTINATGTAPTTASALTIAAVNIAAAKTLTFTGDKAITLTALTDVTALTDYISTNTAGVTIAATLGTADKFTGGAGKDTITVGATTVSSTLGDGDDTLNASVLFGGTATIDAGAGIDTLGLSVANAALLDDSTAFNDDISNFERLSLTEIAASTGAANADQVTLNLTNLDGLNYVTLAGSNATSTNAQVNTISNFATAGTFVQTAILGNANTTVALTGAFTGANDSFTIGATHTGATALVNLGVLTLANVENLTIELDNLSTTTVATTVYDLNLDAVNATTITVTGDTGIDFTNSSYGAVRTLDASGITGTAAAGAVKFAAQTVLQDVVIKGGAGNDTLTGNSGNDTIIGGAGTNALLGGAGNDTITGGDVVDTITGGAGADTLTGGTGADIFVFANSDSVLTGGAGTTGFDTIVDYTTGVDKIDNGGTIALAGSADAAGKATISATGLVTGYNGLATAYDTFAEKVDQIDAALGGTAQLAALFTDAGKTYLYISVGADATNDGTDTIIELTGVTATTGITIVGGDITAIA